MYSECSMKIMTTKEVQVIADIQCDVCHKSTTPHMNPNLYNPQFGALTAKWGYGSKNDGAAYEVHLCEECFFTVLSQIKICVKMIMRVMLMINHLGGFYLTVLSLYDIIGSARSRKGMSVIG